MKNTVQQMKDIVDKYKSINNLKRLEKEYRKYERQKKRHDNHKILKKSRADFIKFKRLSNNIKRWKSFLTNNDQHSHSDEDISSLDISFDSTNSANNSSVTLDSSLSEENTQQMPFLTQISIEDEVNEQEENEEVEISNQCFNCKRKQSFFLTDTYGHDSHYYMNLSSVLSTALHKRKFKHSDVKTNQVRLYHTLCKECNNYLTMEKKFVGVFW